MLSNRPEPPPGAPNGGQEAGLENHLRNLILSNNGPLQDSSTGKSASGITAQGPLKSGATAPGLAAKSQNGIGSNVPTEPSARPPPSKPSRKRMNQAQRRQMSSQLSIPIDPRSQQPPPARSYQSPTSHYSRPSQSYQRHMHTNSHPRTTHYDGRQNGSYGQRSWSGPQQVIGPHGSAHGQPLGIPADSMPLQLSRGGMHLYNSRRDPQFSPEEISAQASLLDRLCFEVVSNSEIERSEIAEKEAFRCRIEAISQEAIARCEKEQNPEGEFDPFSVQLKCFGSLSSGFATKASDMDLGLLSPMSPIQPDAPGSQIPRLLEKAFLDAGLGARLLTRTRVPIIKLCSDPPKKLRQDLLEERFKWENGLDETHEDDEHDHDNDQTSLASPETKTSTSLEVTSPTSLTAEPQSFDIKQGPKNTLASYYGLAKRVLRRAGGRDATVSNYRDLADQDWDILNRVCQAFVAGLSDPQLRGRLARYPSLTFESVGNGQANRSLLGVYTQVEGEQIRQLWEERGVQERAQQPRLLAEQAMKIWEEVQNKVNFGVDPVFYTKELQLALDKMKKAPSVQFVSLEQTQHEAPIVYSTRALNIINALRPASELTASDWTRLVVTQYLNGIHQEEIRKTITDHIASRGGDIPIRVAIRMHKAIHLAWEFERAIEKDLYDESVIPDIKEYIALLRAPFQQSDESSANTDFIISLTPETSGLVARIRALPDPHKLAPNQPRDRYRDRLEFPKTGAGVQCDINFSAHLALHNTALLRCYSLTDPRVRPMVLFVKHWAKMRGINSGYRGTLSSYGYVLMVLHYLVNVAEPFVSPNLQQLAPPLSRALSPVEREKATLCRGHDIQFWRNEEEILGLAQANQLNHNNSTIGHLLRGFFEYYAHSTMLSTLSSRGFDWGRDVLSLRTPGGLLTKQNKGWTGAKTVIVLDAQGAGPHPPPQTEQTPTQVAAPKGQVISDEGVQSKQVNPASKNTEFKEIRHRYLFAIEDPFELDHNVARTVTHNGIVSIRDEFRRAWRIIRSAGNGSSQEELLRDVNDVEEEESPLSKLLDDIHGLGQTRNG
ncbi:hypothetical protein LCI18_014443 [Fusarium solani-melongenae]|uniref:Uncharacterized protein n=1 Tax=Fusarium solani subsp. cucurbitae TaxID=2747967 RepID=A0ACD3ZQ76_FUSSC|nr:hypothetical protein LCI18_014443 [Fusarium solani-melongenae]